MRIFFSSFADEIHTFPIYRHEETNAPDSHPTNGATLSALQFKELEILRQAMPDFRQVITCLGISHDAVEVIRIWDGTLPDKKQFSYSTLYRFSVHKGKIVRKHADPLSL
jgi:hypothetical protein